MGRNNESSAECSICLTTISRRKRGVLPQCKHVFHYACVSQWLEKTPQCPLCRQRTSTSDIKNVEQKVRRCFRQLRSWKKRCGQQLHAAGDYLISKVRYLTVQGISFACAGGAMIYLLAPTGLIAILAGCFVSLGVAEFAIGVAIGIIGGLMLCIGKLLR
ncbi:ring finger domain-containing protein [Ditylenchus destructor]|uniref:Ring finger domain-containing protein n=1 Tax=Ditylenchus destructor TaxID=166010 RepID=A0AAD4RD59_9BILA|nr:ring finger domain-containing protein [Ditylenchus destructor]